MQHTIIQTKVLKVDVCFGIEFTRRFDEGLDKLVILLTPSTLLPETKVKVILQELLIISAAVQDNRKHTVGVDASADGHQHQLCDGDKDATASLVTDAQDFLAVCSLLVIFLTEGVLLSGIAPYR